MFPTTEPCRIQWSDYCSSERLLHLTGLSMRNRNDKGELIASARVVDADIPPLRRVKHNMTSSKTPTALFSSWERYRQDWLRRKDANFCIFAKRCRLITLTNYLSSLLMQTSCARSLHLFFSYLGYQYDRTLSLTLTAGVPDYRTLSYTME